MAEITRFTTDDLEFKPLSILDPDSYNHVFDYIKSIYPEREKKNPVPSALWVLEHGFLRYPAETVYKPPHQIFTAWLRNTKTPTLVALAGLVPDDRGVARAERLITEDQHYFGFFGGHRVHPDYRGRGIGTLMIQHRINELQKYVNKTGTPAAVYAFFDNPLSGHNLEKAGFKNRGERYIEYEKTTQWLFRLQVGPVS